MKAWRDKYRGDARCFGTDTKSCILNFDPVVVLHGSWWFILQVCGTYRDGNSSRLVPALCQTVVLINMYHSNWMYFLLRCVLGTYVRNKGSTTCSCALIPLCKCKYCNVFRHLPLLLHVLSTVASKWQHFFWKIQLESLITDNLSGFLAHWQSLSASDM